MAINNTLGQIGGILPVPNYLGGKPRPNQPQIPTGGSSIATPAQLQAIKAFKPTQSPVPSQGMVAPQPPAQQPPIQTQGTPNVQTYGPGGGGLSPEQIAAADAAEARRVAAGTPNIIQPNNPNNPPAGDVNPAASLTLGGLVPQLLRNAGQNPAVMAAQQNLQELRNQRATAVNQIQGSPGLGLQEASGQQGLLESLFATKEQAAQQALANAQQEQQIQQAGLGTAIGAIQPVTGVPVGTQIIQPGLLGTSQGGVSGGISEQDMNTYTQMLLNGQGAQIPSIITSNPVFQAQLTQRAQQQDPSFNWNKALGTGVSQQTQTQQAQQYTSAAAQAQNLGQQLTQLVTQAGINPNDLNALNSFVQKVATNVSDPNYQTFQNLINDMANTYAQVLTPAGGNTTDMVRQISGSLLNSTQSGQSILQVMKNLDAQVQAKIAGVQTAYGTKSTTSGANPWH